MEIKMRDAILNGDDFEYHLIKYTVGCRTIFNEEILEYVPMKWILENQDKLVEVENNYWDSEGRAIRELESDTEYWYIQIDCCKQISYFGQVKSKKFDFEIGNCFKDKESAEAELTRLKEKQKERMK